MSSTAVQSASPASDSAPPLLAVEGLSVQFPTYDGLVQAVTDLSYTVEGGRTLGIVGESGSGKSVSSMAVLGLHDTRSARITGSIRVNGTEIIGRPESEMMKMRGNTVAMVFQDPLTALHPFYSIGKQIIEAYRIHNNVSKRAARARAIEMLELVGIPQPDSRVDDFPHQFSGGMRQRAMIAMSLVNNPQLIICDEPTTALDVTVQAQILDLLQTIQKEFNSAIIMITHDLGVIAEIADDVLVMYAGRGVEFGATRDVLSKPEMPYTWGLLSSVPDVLGAAEALLPIPGTPPSMLNPPSGCPFHPRCTFVDKVPGDLCVTTLPRFEARKPARSLHLSRCHLPDPDAIYATDVAPIVGVPVVDPQQSDSQQSELPA